MIVLPWFNLHWLDLALVVWMLWAGMGGWFRGWKASAWRLGVFGASIAAALFWRKEFQAVPALREPVEGTLRAMVVSRLALPVFLSSGESVLPWLTFWRDWLLLDPKNVTSVHPIPVDCMVQALFNSSAFGLSLLFWGGVLSLAGALLFDRGVAPGNFFSRLGGLCAGLFRGALLTVSLTGLLLPFLLLGPLVWEWGALDRAHLFRLCMHLFNSTGIWWD